MGKGKGLIPTLVMLVLTVTLVGFSSFHPMHVSVMEVEFDKESKAIESSLHVFIDDIQDDFRRLRNEKDLDIMLLSEDQRNSLLKPYFEQRLAFDIDNKVKALQYLGHLVEGEAFYIFIEVPNVKKLKTLEVTNTTLLDLYDDQINLIHFEHNHEVHTERLDRKQTSATYILNEL